ncbi:hypothetical protein [Xanthomonas albilineans]|nr:hypothetical protein [Xanthomonas albilineans]
MNRANVFRFSIAFALSVCLAAGLSALAWPIAMMARAFVLYLIFALFFALWIGLPAYSFLRSKYKDSMFCVVVIVSIVYGFVYFIIRIFLKSSEKVEIVDGVSIVKNGILTLSGLYSLICSAGEVFVIGCASNLIFWIIFARFFRKKRLAS